jgi:uncharacterized protein (DUF433 family)
VVPAIGPLRLDEVAPRHIKQLILRLRNAGKLAPCTIRHVSSVMCILLMGAVAGELDIDAPARSPIVGRHARTVAADLWHNRDRVMRYERITLQPDQMGGQPCIRGLRIPVATVVAMVADGMTHDEILAAFPYLERADIAEALRSVAK